MRRAIAAIAGVTSPLPTVSMATFTVERSLDLVFFRAAKSNERPDQTADDDAARRLSVGSSWSDCSTDVVGKGIRRDDRQPNESDSL